MADYPKIFGIHFGTAAMCLLLLAWGCSKDDEVGPDLPNRTILYYLGADNNLHLEADEKIEALRLGFPGGNNRLVIYRDGYGTPPELLEVHVDETGENQVRAAKTYPEQNSATGETLQLVLNDVKQFFPADSYGLILFSHASGWLPKGSLTRPENAQLSMGLPRIKTYTIAMDGLNELDLNEFASAIPDGFFDFIAFEACFMAGIEVLYELKDKTDYILSSSAEIVSPGFTPVYPESLPLLYEPHANLVGFARAYFDFWNSQSGDYRSATITVAKTTGLLGLATWVKQRTIDESPATDLLEIQHFDRYSNHRLFFDLKDYYRHKIVAAIASELDDLLSSIVVYQAATPAFIPGQLGFEINTHSGITTYILQDRFENLNRKYRELSWYKATRPQ